MDSFAAWDSSLMQETGQVKRRRGGGEGAAAGEAQTTPPATAEDVLLSCFRRTATSAAAATSQDTAVTAAAVTAAAGDEQPRAATVACCAPPAAALGKNSAFSASFSSSFPLSSSFDSPPSPSSCFSAVSSSTSALTSSNTSPLPATADVNFLSPSFSAAAALAASSSSAAGAAAAVDLPVPEATPLPHFHLTRFLLPFALQQQQASRANSGSSSSNSSSSNVCCSDNARQGGQGGEGSSGNSGNSSSSGSAMEAEMQGGTEDAALSSSRSRPPCEQQSRFVEELTVARNKQFRRDILTAVQSRKEEAVRAASILRERFTGGGAAAHATPLVELLRRWQQQQQEVHAVVLCRSSSNSNWAHSQAGNSSNNAKGWKVVAGFVCWFDKKLNLLLQPARLLREGSTADEHSRQQRQQQSCGVEKEKADQLCCTVGWLYIRERSLVSSPLLLLCGREVFSFSTPPLVLLSGERSLLVVLCSSSAGLGRGKFSFFRCAPE